MADGAIKLRGKSWYVIFPYIDAATGAYKRKWERAAALGFPNTEKGAKQALRKRLAEVDAGTLPVARGRETVDAWVESYIAARRTRQHTPLKPSTRFSYRQMHRLYIRPALGAKALHALTGADVRRWVADLERRAPPLKASTIGIAWTLLHGALAQAVNDRLVPRNVATPDTRPVSARETPTTTLTPAQLVAFLAVSDAHELAAYWRIMALAGLRVGEATGLRWDDIDWRRGVVMIQRTMTRGEDGRLMIGTSTKSASSHAAVSVPRSVIAALRVQRDRQTFMRQQAGEHWTELGLVFTRADGRPMSYKTIYSMLKRLGAQIGVPTLAPHGLRHAAATFALSENQHPRVVQARLRHASLEQTMQYMQVLPPISEAAANELDDALERVARRSETERADEAR